MVVRRKGLPSVLKHRVRGQDSSGSTIPPSLREHPIYEFLRSELFHIITYENKKSLIIVKQSCPFYDTAYFGPDAVLK